MAAGMASENATQILLAEANEYLERASFRGLSARTLSSVQTLWRTGGASVVAETSLTAAIAALESRHFAALDVQLLSYQQETTDSAFLSGMLKMYQDSAILSGMLSAICEAALDSSSATVEDPFVRVQLLGLASRYRYTIKTALEKRYLLLGGLLRRYYRRKLQQISFGDATDQASKLLEGTFGQELKQMSMSAEGLGLTELNKDAYSSAILKHYRQELTNKLETTFNECILLPPNSFGISVPLMFLNKVLPDGEKSKGLAVWQEKLTQQVFEAVGTLRIEKMFEIVVDYPDSLPAIRDLKFCLQNTNLHRQLITVFRKSIQDRLLHPGAATTDIIQQYISTIKALMYVDPSGAVLHVIAEPIRDYLRSRKDTTRCIVTMLADDEDGASSAQSLLEELGNAEIQEKDLEFDGIDADEQAIKAAQTWEPDNLDTDAARLTYEQKAGDVIGMLVGIYGTKELFLKEYRSMLSDRLLTKSEYECDRELRTLELLKVRFGEGSLHSAEIMLKDITDSKRINANVQGVPNNATPLKRRKHLVNIENLTATIISYLFWPQLPQEEDFSLPAEVKAMLDTYGHKYHMLKSPRVLEWKSSLGSVTLDLRIGEQDLEFTVPPFLATILLLFQDREEWSIQELANVLSVSAEFVRKKIMFWINQGVISEMKSSSGSSFVRNEKLLKTAGTPGEIDVSMDIDRETNDQGNMDKYEQFILGMLTNFDSLPLDRIHNMLKMFHSDPPYDRTLEQLDAFMGILLADEKIAVSGKLYKKR